MDDMDKPPTSDDPGDVNCKATNRHDAKLTLGRKARMTGHIIPPTRQNQEEFLEGALNKPLTRRFLTGPTAMDRMSAVPPKTDRYSCFDGTLESRPHYPPRRLVSNLKEFTAVNHGRLFDQLANF
jgi:hypothetical protein